MKESSMKLTSIRKKVRGFRRRARKLPLWGNHFKNLDLDILIKYRKEYVKLWINPFCNLYQISNSEVGKKIPPYRFRNQILFQLIEIYLEWERKLKELDESYYLKIWIGDPEFTNSQVVTAINSEISYYEHIFIKDTEPKPFPYINNHPSFISFTWERCVNGYFIWESDLESIGEISDIERKAYKISEESINGKIERSFYIRTGDMWTGSIRRSGNIT